MLFWIYSGHKKSGDRVAKPVQFYVVCIKIKQTNIMLNCKYMHSRYAECIVEINLMLDVSEFPET